MPDDQNPEPGEIIKTPAPKPDGLKKDDVFDPSRTAEDEEHAKRMKELFPDLDDEDDPPETIEEVRAERNKLQEQVERIKTSVARTRKENSALMQQVNQGKDAIAAIEALRSKDKKEATANFLGELLPVADALAAGLKEIDAQERAANPKLDKLTTGVESTLSQLTAVFNKHGVKPGTPAPAAKTPENKTPDDTPGQPPQDTPPEAGKPGTPEVEKPAPEKSAIVETIEGLKAERDALMKEVSSISSLVGKAQSDNLVLQRRIEEGKQLLAREETKREEDKQFAIEKPLKDLMPVIDTLELGLKAINPKARAEDPNFDALAKVVDSTLAEVRKVFNKYGVSQIDPLDQPFDEERHEAVTMQPRPDTDPMTVIHVVQKGYELNKRNIRHAKVVVTPPD